MDTPKTQLVADKQVNEAKPKDCNERGTRERTHSPAAGILLLPSLNHESGAGRVSASVVKNPLAVLVGVTASPQS
jgi:hypothetical protein